MGVQLKQNVIDLLLQRLGLDGHGKYTALAKRFGVTRMRLNGWKDRNCIPRDYLQQANELGLAWDELCSKKPENPKTAYVSMKDVINDPTHYFEIARGGTTIDVTVNGKTVVKISGAEVRL